MAVRATFTGFDAYKLNGVTVTDRVLGYGSYATVLELEYMGLKCAGKKIHELLLEQGNASYTVRRFEEECRLLSQVRHPNVVQFLGVHFQQGVPAPILVMEFLPINLSTCIEQYDILSNEISYSILHDVALGLCYLHSQTPPIIHRDLSANNVLLATNMLAKISDLGVARILNLTTLQVSRMTGSPGTPAYMPPEVMIATPKYDTSVDEFSYGILMIHMFSGRWPEPQVGQIRTEPGRLIPVTEAERREVFLRTIGNDHPLMDLILKCIDNHPPTRAHTSEIVERLAEMVLQFPLSFANRLEMLRKIKYQEEEMQVMRKEREAENERNNQQNLILSLQKEAEKKDKEIVRLNLVSSSEIEQLKLEVRDLSAQNQLLTATKEAHVRVCKEKDAIITGMKEQLTRTKEHLSSKKHVVQASITWKQCADIPTVLSSGKTTVINGKVYCGGGETDVYNDDSLYIVFCYDSSQDNWTTLPPLPVRYFGLGQVNGKVVAVGGEKWSDGRRTNEVFTYDERSRTWKQTLPPMATVRYYPGVLSLQSALVVAGGATSSEDTNTVEIFNANTSLWYKTDPLPTACRDISLVIIGNTCYALGGFNTTLGYLNQALYASVDELLRDSNQTTHSGRSADTQSAWKTLTNTLTYAPAAAVIAGNLHAIGGSETSKGGADMKKVYMFSPSTNNWINISNLRKPRSEIAVAVLSSTEILVIGGSWCDDHSVYSVYKGTLSIKL